MHAHKDRGYIVCMCSTSGSSKFSQYNITVLIKENNLLILFLCLMKVTDYSKTSTLNYFGGPDFGNNLIERYFIKRFCTNGPLKYKEMLVLPAYSLTKDLWFKRLVICSMFRGIKTEPKIYQ